MRRTGRRWLWPAPRATSSSTCLPKGRKRRRRGGSCARGLAEMAGEVAVEGAVAVVVAWEMGKVVAGMLEMAVVEGAIKKPRGGGGKKKGPLPELLRESRIHKAIRRLRKRCLDHYLRIAHHRHRIHPRKPLLRRRPLGNIELRGMSQSQASLNPMSLQNRLVRQTVFHLRSFKHRNRQIVMRVTLSTIV